MAVSCNSCKEIREIDPSLIVNGFTSVECTSLKNNTGLSPSSGNDNEEDIGNLIDCLVGNMAEELSLIDLCDWKEYMGSFVKNVWTVLKAMACSEAGLWIGGGGGGGSSTLRRSTQTFTTTAGQSSFTFAPSGYTYSASDLFSVYVNGLKLTSAEFTRSNNEITLTTPISLAGQTVEIIAEGSDSDSASNSVSSNASSELKRSTQIFTTTANQSAFTFAPSGYTYSASDLFSVYVNGLKLASSEFTRSNNVITLVTPISLAGQTVEIVADITA